MDVQLFLYFISLCLNSLAFASKPIQCLANLFLEALGTWYTGFSPNVNKVPILGKVLAGYGHGRNKPPPAFLWYLGWLFCFGATISTTLFWSWVYCTAAIVSNFLLVVKLFFRALMDHHSPKDPYYRPGRYAMVVNASEGVGKAMAAAFWGQGYSLVLLGKTAEQLQSLDTYLHSLNGWKHALQRVHYFLCDSASKNVNLDEVFGNEVQIWNGSGPSEKAPSSFDITFLVNNIGCCLNETLLSKLSDAEMDNALQMSVHSFMEITQHLISNSVGASTHTSLRSLGPAARKFRMATDHPICIANLTCFASVPGTPYKDVHMATKAMIGNWSNDLRNEISEIEQFTKHVSVIYERGNPRNISYERLLNKNFHPVPYNSTKATSTAVTKYSGPFSQPILPPTAQKTFYAFASIIPNALDSVMKFSGLDIDAKRFRLQEVSPTPFPRRHLNRTLSNSSTSSHASIIAEIRKRNRAHFQEESVTGSPLAKPPMVPLRAEPRLIPPPVIKQSALVEIQKPKPVEIQKPKPVETQKSTPVEVQKSEPVEVQELDHVEAQKPGPIEAQKPGPIEVEKAAQTVLSTKDYSITAPKVTRISAPASTVIVSKKEKAASGKDLVPRSLSASVVETSSKLETPVQKRAFSTGSITDADLAAYTAKTKARIEMLQEFQDSLIPIIGKVQTPTGNRTASASSTGSNSSKRSALEEFKDIVADIGAIFETPIRRAPPPSPDTYDYGSNLLNATLEKSPATSLNTILEKSPATSPSIILKKSPATSLDTILEEEFPETSSPSASDAGESESVYDEATSQPDYFYELAMEFKKEELEKRNQDESENSKEVDEASEFSFTKTPESMIRKVSRSDGVIKNPVVENTPSPVESRPQSTRKPSPRLTTTRKSHFAEDNALLRRVSQESQGSDSETRKSPIFLSALRSLDSENNIVPQTIRKPYLGLSAVTSPVMPEIKTTPRLDSLDGEENYSGIPDSPMPEGRVKRVLREHSFFYSHKAVAEAKGEPIKLSTKSLIPVKKVAGSRRSRSPRKKL